MSALLLVACTNDLDFGTADASADAGDGGVSLGDAAPQDGGPGLALTLERSLPQPGASGVAVTTGLELRFAQEVFPGEGAFRLLEALDAIEIDAVPVESDQVDFDGRDVFVQWSSPLHHSTTYSVVIAPGVVVGRDGRSFAQLREPGAFTFTTVAPDPIELLSTEPANGADDAPLDAELVMTFDAEIVLGPVGGIQLIEAQSDDVVYRGQLSDNPDVEVDEARLTLRVPEPLTYDTQYYVVLDADAVRSRAGASYEGFDDEQFFSFTTMPPPKPRLVSSAPLDDALDVDPLARLVLIFDQPVQPGMGSISLYQENGSLVEAFDVDGMAVTFSDVSVTLTPSAPLAPSTKYYVSVAAGAVQTAFGARNDSIDEPWAFNFTTASEPPPPVALVGSVPASDATDVDAETDIVLIFSEAVEPRSGSVTVFRASDGAVFESVPVDDPRVVVMGDTVTIDLRGRLQDDTEYYVTVGAGALESVRGASFPGVLDPSRLSFRTDDPFVLVSVSPADGAVDVDVRTDLVLTFSAPTAAGSGELVLSSGSVVARVALDDARVSFDAEVVTVDLQDVLAHATEYSVSVSAGAIVERGAGASGASAIDWSFSTIAACDAGELLGENGRCYFVRADAGSEVTWGGARQACENRGSGWDLAAISSENDQVAITSLLNAVAPAAQVWIGASDEAEEGTWIWVNDGQQFWRGGVSGSTVSGSFAHWKSDQPSGSGQDCARLVPENGDYLWADAPCDDGYGFLCSGPAN